MNSPALGHDFKDAIICGIERRQQGHVQLATNCKIITAGRALMDGTAGGELQGLVADNYGEKTIVRFDILVMPGIGRNL